MQNNDGDCVDMYIPRRCSATSRVIAAKDHASIQIAIAQVDEKGFATGASIPVAICGQIRKMGESDDCINRFAKKEGVLPISY